MTKVLDATRTTAYLKGLSRSQPFLSAEGKERRIESLLNSSGEPIGQSHAMRELYRTLGQVAATDAPVLVSGESGTGKELVARTLHDLSPRRDGPFMALNCAAIPPTLMESEILGHEKGAFTGAVERRLGCFEQSDGGRVNDRRRQAARAHHCRNRLRRGGRR